MGRTVEGAFDDFDVVDEPVVDVQQGEREDLPFLGAELEEDKVVEHVRILEYGRAGTELCAGELAGVAEDRGVRGFVEGAAFG